jgi:penicillin-binding protein 1A
LGTPEISVFEMVGSYSAFANEGIHTDPIFITKIEDKNGNIIYENYPNFKEVLSPEVANIMQDMLKYVVDAGTAQRLRYAYGLSGNIGGKTGTTQSNADGWFIGITPDLIAGCWVGCEDRLVRFRSTGLGQGASMALPIWGKFFSKVSNDKSLNIDLNKNFVQVEPHLRTIELDCSKYKWGISTYDNDDEAKVIDSKPIDDAENKYDNYEETFEDVESY